MRRNVNFRKEIKVLGNIVSKGCIKVDPERIEHIKAYPTPTTVKELRSFLGTINYCREFVGNFAILILTAPLYEILKGEKKSSCKKINLDEHQIRVFKLIKEEMSRSTERAQPNFNEEFILTTDASDSGIGAVLTQKDRWGKELIISTFSKKLDKCQMNYSVTDKELLGVVKGIEHYRHYLLGKKFKIRTDHKALTYLWESRNHNSRLLRWFLKLSEYSFDVEYIKGEENFADGFSRLRQNRDINTLEVMKLSDSDKNEILNKYHLISGHGSVNTMKFMISQNYKWPGMYKDIDNFYRRCDICLRSEGPKIQQKIKLLLRKTQIKCGKWI